MNLVSFMCSSCISWRGSLYYYSNFQIHYEFAKMEVPESVEDREGLAKKLQKYISLTQYTHTLKQQELKP